MVCPLSVPPQRCRLLSVILRSMMMQRTMLMIGGEGVVTLQKRSSVDGGSSKWRLSDSQPSLGRFLIIIPIAIRWNGWFHFYYFTTLSFVSTKSNGLNVSLDKSFSIISPFARFVRSKQRTKACLGELPCPGNPSRINFAKTGNKKTYTASNTNINDQTSSGLFSKCLLLIVGTTWTNSLSLSVPLFAVYFHFSHKFQLPFQFMFFTSQQTFLTQDKSD